MQQTITVFWLLIQKIIYSDLILYVITISIFERILICGFIVFQGTSNHKLSNNNTEIVR